MSHCVSWVSGSGLFKKKGFKGSFADAGQSAKVPKPLKSFEELRLLFPVC